MKGDPGPYTNDDGDVWVPRTVPWRQARGVASEVPVESYQRLRYIGKSDADLLGFTRDCSCDEVCEMANRCRTCGADQVECGCDVSDPEDWDICRVPAWHFEIVEP